MTPRNTKQIFLCFTLLVALVLLINLLVLKEVPLFSRHQSPDENDLCSAEASPVISVVIPCYMQSHYLEETIESVLAQSYTRWEIVIVEDMIGGHCLPVAMKYVLKYPCKIRAYEKPNGGLADARNFGITHASGTWICALDSDDKITPDYFQSAMEALSRHGADADPEQRINLVYANQKFFGDNEWLWEVPRFESARIFENGPFPVMTLFSRELFDAVGGYDPSLPWGDEDYNFWVNCAKIAGGIRALKLDMVGSLYRFKKHSMMRTKERFAEELKWIFRFLHSDMFTREQSLKHAQLLRAALHEETVDEMKKINQKYPGLWLPYFIFALREKDSPAGRIYMMQCIERAPDSLAQIIMQAVHQSPTTDLLPVTTNHLPATSNHPPPTSNHPPPTSSNSDNRL